MSHEVSHCGALARSGPRIQQWTETATYLTYRPLISKVKAMCAAKELLAEEPKQKLLPHSRRQEAAVSILRTTDYLRRFCSRLFYQHGITSQQYNVLRILRGAGPRGLPTLDIAERMIEQTPGITRLLDRLEAKKVVRRQRPSSDRRQVLCYITKEGVDLLRKLDAPVKNQANAALRMLKDSEIEELIRLLERARSAR